MDDRVSATRPRSDDPWRDYFLYYYWEQNYPQTPTHFSLRGDQYKYKICHGLWDTDEFFDIKNDPEEQNNLIHDPTFQETKQHMQNRLYTMMEDQKEFLNRPKDMQNRTCSKSRWRESCRFP